MSWQFKKIISVLFAVLIGAGIVFFAWRSENGSEGKVSSLDNTNWVDSLSVVPQKNSSNTLGSAGANITIDTSSATTTTDVIAQRLLAEYMRSQAVSATTTMSDVEANRIANLLAQEVVAPQERQYKLSDINMSSDNSRDANIVYIDTVNILVKKQMDSERSENELSILLSAMNTGNVATLNKLDAKAALYQQLLNKFLALKTPSRLASIHLHLLQGFEALRSSTLKMKDSLNDPTTGLAALSSYSKGVAIVSSLKKEYNDYFSKQ